MLLVLTPEESQRLDAAAADPVDVLMDRAGHAVALAAAREGAGYGSRVSVLAGPGNNGGDGYVAARYLADRGCSVTVEALAQPREGTAAAGARALAVRTGIPVRVMGDAHPTDLVIDALFGVGFRGQLPPEVKPWLEVEAPVLAVDVPSGLDASTGEATGEVFSARRTVTFHALKPGHLLGSGPELCGAVELVDIGLEGGDPAFLVTEESDAPRPVRDRNAHKWSAGSVIVVGGSPGIAGAAVLTGRAALAMGAGSAAVACPEGLAPVVAGMGPGLMTRPVGSGDRFGADDLDELLRVADRFDVMIAGPGLGDGVEELCTRLLEAWDRPLVLDADGINALDGTEGLASRDQPSVVTPHAGEFRRLTGRDADYRAAMEVAEATGSVILLKGNPTFVLGTEAWAVTSGGPELATIGTGDVLAGMVGALIARGLDHEVAARSAAYWHGRAGADLARGRAVTAEDLAGLVGRYAW